MSLKRFACFLDVDEDTMGLSPSSVLTYLENNADVTDLGAVNKFNAG